MAIITKEDNEMVVRCINELLGCTYIVRDFPADASRYSFLRGHLEDARERLLPIGFDIESSTDAGVFMLKRSSDFAESPISNMNWRAFRAEQLKVLLVLLIMYSGSISVERTKATTFGMINENLNAYFPELKVKPRKEALAFLKKWKLIHFSGKAERLSDVSHGTFWNWSQGTEPRDEKLREISNYFGVRTKWLKSGRTPVLDKRVLGKITVDSLSGKEERRAPTLSEAIEEFKKDVIEEFLEEEALKEKAEEQIPLKETVAEKEESPAWTATSSSMASLDVINSCISRLVKISPDKAKRYYRALQEIRISLEGSLIFEEAFSANMMPEEELLGIINEIVSDIKELGLNDSEARETYKILSEKRASIEMKLIG